MVRRTIFVLIFFAVLIAGVLIEQNYTDKTFYSLTENIQTLETNIKDQDLEKSKNVANNLKLFWDDKEVFLSLFVDYKDIEQIGRQMSLILSHLDNEDFELASVECGLLKHIVKTYYSTIKFDWQNII